MPGLTIDAINNHNAHPGRQLSFYINAIDTFPNVTMTFSLINPPQGAAVDSESGEFTWTPTPAQLAGSPYALTVQVADSAGHTATSPPFTITVTNQVPAFDPIATYAAYPGQNLAFYINATDPDGDPLQFSLVSGPADAYVDPNTGQFNWTPAANIALTTYSATVRVTDACGASPPDVTFNINVTNQKPTLDDLPVGRTAHPGVMFSFYAVGIDPDGDELTYTLTNPPTGASIDPNSGLFSWTPQWNQWSTTGTNAYTITVVVTDSSGQPATKSCTVTVVNQAPVIGTPASGPLPTRSVHSGQLLQFAVNAYDPDGDPVQFSLTTSPPGASIDPNSGLFSWTPPPSYATGAEQVTVRATDPGGAYTEAQFSVSVQNDPPALPMPPARAAHPGNLVTFYANGTDPDGEPLTYSMTAGPRGASIDPNSGQFSWTPDWTQLGPASITLQVSDPANNTASRQFTLPVNNQAPTIENIPGRTVAVGTLLQFYVNASDLDFDTLTFSLQGTPPPGASIDPNTGQFSWTPAATGAYPISVQVCDGDGSHPCNAQFTITVNAAYDGDRRQQRNRPRR